jgi:pimeloyl-ACP methyl ester carboxylesterase
VRVPSSRAPRLIAATLTAGLALSAIGCNQAQNIRAQALRDSHPVTFRAQDGNQLAGRLFGPDTASAGVVLSQMVPSDQSAWFDFADRLGVAGYRVLTFDLSGVCPGGDAGCSKGASAPQGAWQDVMAAQAYLRAQGVTRIALVGAGLGGTASLVVAARQPPGLEAVITLSAAASTGGLAAGPDVVQTITAAKLFLAGDDDTLGADSAQAFYDSSVPPKDVQLLTTADQGTDLLTGNQGEQTGNLIVGWLTRYLPVTPSSSLP